jgi:hypothetical protein
MTGCQWNSQLRRDQPSEDPPSPNGWRPAAPKPTRGIGFGEDRALSYWSRRVIRQDREVPSTRPVLRSPVSTTEARRHEPPMDCPRSAAGTGKDRGRPPRPIRHRRNSVGFVSRSARLATGTDIASSRRGPPGCKARPRGPLPGSSRSRRSHRRMPRGPPGWRSTRGRCHRRVSTSWMTSASDDSCSSTPHPEKPRHSKRSASRRSRSRRTISPGGASPRLARHRCYGFAGLAELVRRAESATRRFGCTSSRPLTSKLRVPPLSPPLLAAVT